MVFQRPNPFPKSIFDNVAYGLRINGIKGSTSEMVEKSLRRAALWKEVEGSRCTSRRTRLSGGQTAAAVHRAGASSRAGSTAAG